MYLLQKPLLFFPRVNDLYEKKSWAADEGGRVFIAELTFLFSTVAGYWCFCDHYKFPFHKKKFQAI